MTTSVQTVEMIQMTMMMNRVRKGQGDSRKHLQLPIYYLITILHCYLCRFKVVFINIHCMHISTLPYHDMHTVTT